MNHAMTMLGALLLLGLASPGCDDSATAPPPPVYDFTPLTRHVEAVLDTLELGQGAAIVLIQGGHVIYERGFGGVTPMTPVPLASAAKWLTAVTVLTVVDDGDLSLETPMGDLLPQNFFVLDDGKDGITVRELLSQTAGLIPSHACIYQDQRTLEECTLFIGSRALVRPPGTAFIYGQPTFTVAGSAAEAASGRAWSEIFEREVRRRLGMSTVEYLGGDNPQLGDGALGSARDYARMLESIVDGGGDLLSSGLVREMLSNQLAGKEIVVTPRGPSLGYGLGAWIEREDPSGRALRVSSPGSSGFWPWIDFERDLVGVIAAPPRIEVTGELIGDVLAMVEQIVPAGEPVAGSPTGVSSSPR